MPSPMVCTNVGRGGLFKLHLWGVVMSMVYAWFQKPKDYGVPGVQNNIGLSKEGVEKSTARKGCVS